MQPLQRRHNKVRERRLQVSTEVSSWLNFNPLSLSPALWLDAADIATITESSGSVSQWDDKSGNGRNVTQGTGISQPTTNSVKQNGLNVLSFDGSNDFLSSANDALNFATIQLFIVARSGTALRTIIGVPHASTHVNPFFRYLLFHAANNALNIRLNGTSSLSANNLITTGAAQLFKLESDTGDAYGNGVRFIDATGVSLTYPNSTPLRIGANANGAENLNGIVAEVLIFDYGLSISQTAQVNSYLNNKWRLYP